MSLARGFLSGLSLPQALNVIINISVILRRRNLFEMGAVQSDRESRSVALVWRLGVYSHFASLSSRRSRM